MGRNTRDRLSMIYRFWSGIFCMVMVIANRCKSVCVSDQPSCSVNAVRETDARRRRSELQCSAAAAVEAEAISGCIKAMHVYRRPLESAKRGWVIRSIFAEWAEFFPTLPDEYGKRLVKEGCPRLFWWTTPRGGPACQLCEHSPLTLCPC
jgi:hypothetical protein